MNSVTINSAKETDFGEMDGLLWSVLWQPLGLPHNVRQAFSVEGEKLNLVAKENGQIVGCLVGVWTWDNEVELRHLAITSYAQHLGIGRRLVAEFVRMVAAKGCYRIHTIARNTSAGFFRKLGFHTAPGKAPEHPAFIKHGITFELMERIVDLADASEGIISSI